jgi:rhamnogalacturonan endolyase
MKRFTTFLAAFIIALACSSLSRAQNAAGDGVSVTEDAASFTLSNGIVTAKVLKRNGDILSLQYHGTETLTDQSGHAGAYWSHDAGGGAKTIDAITIDPKTNNGDRAEVSVKGISGGKKMGHPAGGGADGDFPVDIEIRCSMGRGEPGVYTYCIFEHLPEYPAGSIGEARFCAKLAAMYDWLSVDAKRNKYYPREPAGEDKYVYTAVQSENLAYGWSSTTKNTGFWIINPTIEYLSGGPTKVEFLCHRDTTQVQAPCVLNYWRSSHYGGAGVTVAAGEHWSKVVGPFMLYVNSGGDAMALWNDAKKQAEKEKAKWPFDWVNGVDYPHKDQRSAVSGQLVLNDPFMPGGAKYSGKITVGLVSPNYNVAVAGRGGAANAPTTNPAPMTREMTWQTDAKHYEFWARSEDPTGKFTIPSVRPGSYQLDAFADGVLGEYVQADVKIPEGGKPVDLGQLDWKPVRRGKQLWDIGIANRTATEFKNGDRYFEMDTQLQYPKLFPNDVDYTIGKSDFSQDWYFEQVPHNTDPNAQVVPFTGIRGKPGNATPNKIHFMLADAPTGTATLRLAICAASTRSVDVSVNDKAAGVVDRLPGGDSTLVRHGVQGIWYEREFPFDAAMMKQGENVLTLTVPAGPVNSGIIYDYIRLELDQAKPFAAQ